MEYPNLTVTFLIEFKNKFLLISRAKNASNFPSLWAFPGGKVEFEETVIDTIKREVKEETGLDLHDEACFLDSYFFKKTVGIAFMVRAKSCKVIISDEIVDYRWVSDIQDLDNYNCIPGIYNHLLRAKELLLKNKFDSLEDMNLSEIKYVNR